MLSSTTDEIKSLELQLLEKKIERAVEMAYAQGVEDARAKDAFPPVLRKEHLCEIFQCSMPMTSKLVARADFPKLEAIQARYPRDQVFAWIERNSSTFGSELLHFQTS